MSESVNISGDFNGTLIVNGESSQSPPVGESFTADVVWEGKLYRMELNGKQFTKNELAEALQGEYPGAIVHNIYPSQYQSNSALRVTGIKRYQPERLSWSD